MADTYGQNMIQVGLDLRKKNWQNSLEDLRRKEIIRQFLSHFRRLYGADERGFEGLMDIFKEFFQKRQSLAEVLDQVRRHLQDKIELNYYFDLFLPQAYRFNINQELAKIVSHKIKKKAPAIRALLTQYKEKRMTAHELSEKAREATDDDDIFFGVINFIKAQEELKRHGYYKRYNSLRKRTERFFYDDVAWRQLRHTIQLLEEEEKSFTKNEILFFFKLKSCLDEMTRSEQDQLPPDSQYTPMGYFEEVAGCIKLYNLGVISANELMDLLSNTLHQFDPAIKEQLRSILAAREGARRNNVVKALCETNISPQQMIRITPSYLVVPEQTPITICSGKTEMGKTLLNERYVSIPSGSEHFSFKHMRKNVFEDALFKAEDEQFQLDMEITNLEQAKEYMKGLYVHYKHAEAPIKFQGLDQLRIRSLKKIYSSSLKSVLKLMETNPVQVCKVVLNRVREVLREMKEKKEEKKREWQEVYDKNFRKSLDHRSFYFKQNEKKNVNHKNFVTELKHRKELVAQNPRALMNIKLGGSGDSLFFSSFSFNQFPPSVLVPKVEPEIQTSKLLTDMECMSMHEVPQYRFLWNQEELLITTLTFIKSTMVLNYNSELQRASTVWLSRIEQDLLGLNITSGMQVYDPEVSEKYVDPRLKLPNSSMSGFLEPFLEKKLQNEPFEMEKLSVQEFPAFSRQIHPMNLNQYTPSFKLHATRIREERLDSALSVPYLPQHEGHMRVFYGSTLMYSIIRFIYTIYDRLLVAQDLGGKRIDQELKDRSYQGKRYSEIFNASDVKQIKQQLFSRFMIGVQMFLRNQATIEVGKYEEFCRNLLGSQAYLLFGIEKLVANTVKHINVLINNKTEQQLIDVFYDAQILAKGKNYDQIYFSLSLPFLVALDNQEPIRFTHDPEEMILSINLLTEGELSARTRALQHTNLKLEGLAAGEKFSTFELREEHVYVIPQNQEDDPEEANYILKNGSISKVLTDELEVVMEPGTGDYFARVRKETKKKTDFHAEFKKSSDFRAAIDSLINQ